MPLYEIEPDNGPRVTINAHQADEAVRAAAPSIGEGRRLGVRYRIGQWPREECPLMIYERHGNNWRPEREQGAMLQIEIPARSTG